MAALGRFLPQTVTLLTLLEEEKALVAERGPGVHIRDAETRAIRRKGMSEEAQLLVLLHAANRSKRILAALHEKGSAFGRTLPTPAKYEAFFRAEILPVRNQLSGRSSWCLACGDRFPRRTGQEYCTKKCGNRIRKQGENSLAGVTARGRKHFGKCHVCKVGKLLCPKGQRFWEWAKRSTKGRKGDAMTRKSPVQLGPRHA